MEVHHSHHPTHKKKWTGYLLEFFMLFLAVFLGFYAENIREHSIERHREKEYMESEISDLTLDTLRFTRLIARQEHRILQLDSLIDFLHSNNYTDHLNDMYFLGRIASLNPRFYYSDRTMQQLKNAGALRLVRSKAVSDSLMNYDSRISLIKNQDEIISAAAIEYTNQAANIFDPYIFYKIMPGALSSAIRPLDSPALLSTEKMKINQVMSKLVYLRSIIVVTIDIYKSTKSQAITLIDLIKKEYHFSERTPLEK